MSDLIESLREEADIADADDCPVMAEFLRRCADRIEELQAQIDTQAERMGQQLRLNGELQARVETLANFNPDWDMLEATQESLREHMQIIRKLNDGIEGLTRANEALIETNKELTTEAREAFAAGFKARHETPDINRAWEDWYTRQNTEQGESDE